LQLRKEKCAFCVSKVKYLGMILTEQGVQPDPAKVAAIRGYPVPRNVGELRSFLGLSGYCRRWVRDYARRAAPLTALLGSEPWKWTETEDRAFNDLRLAIEEEALLHHPDFSSGADPFVLMVDACALGVGAVLLQGARPIQFFSKRFPAAKATWAAGELELLGIVTAVNEFRAYIWGKGCIVNCDHKNIAALVKSPPNERVEKLASRLAGYDLDLRNVPAAQQRAADALSRAPIMVLTRAQQHRRGQGQAGGGGDAEQGPAPAAAADEESIEAEQTRQLQELQHEDPTLAALASVRSCWATSKS
jgi:hypothetical protein